MRRTLLVAAITIGLGLGVLTGCGGSSPAGGLTGQSATDPESEPSAEPSEPAAEPKTNSGDEAAYCKAAKDMQGKLTNAEPGKGIETILDGFAAVEKVAPADIKPQWTAYLDAYQQFADANKAFKDPKRMKNASKMMQDASAKMQGPGKATTADLMKRCS